MCAGRPSFAGSFGGQGGGVGRNRTESDEPDKSGWTGCPAGWMANGNMADRKCVPVSEVVIEGKAPEKTGALQKLRQFVATWRGAGPQMDGNSYGINWLLTDSLRVESIIALSSPR